jgi:hypothetical protein
VPTKPSPESLSGSCLCGGVTYRIRGSIGPMSHCHCTMCQKSHGAAFGTYAPVSWDSFELLSGEDLLQRYRSSDHVTRTFCSRCGSNLQYVPDHRSGFGLAVATLDEDPGTKVALQIWVKDKAPWWNLTDEPPWFETVPPKERGA